MRRTKCLLVLFCMFTGLAVAQDVAKSNFLSPDGQVKERAPGAQGEATEEFIIGPEDVLSITVWHEPDLTNKVTVRPDGKIGIPLLNDVQASGLTPKQLQEQITEEIGRASCRERV